MHKIAFQKELFVRDLFAWFEKNKRDLPWRKNYTPYEVWISEMMLQQTQMERGVQYFQKWMQTFRSPSDIADAPLEKVLQLWEGLGYYSRARNIYASAQIIRDRYQGVIPCDEEKIKSLKGIGDYTLCAIMGIAFQQDYVTVDANVERVFARLLNCTEKNLKKAVKPAVQALLPKGQARIYNQALMELGALVCKKNPQCGQCPLVPYCESKKLGVEKERPLPKEKKEHIPVLAAFCIMENENGQQLIHRRTEAKLWHNMWEYPGIDSILFDAPQNGKDLLSLAEQSLSIELSELTGVCAREICFSESPACIKSNYTNHKLTAYFFRWKIGNDVFSELRKKFSEPDFVWTENTEKYAMPSHHRKAQAGCHRKSDG